ncbi:MAG: 16S rRNA processing protein RimM [Gammaproteobacteria bacterium RIFCSPLOWO2_02_FULL_42_14]|nr:MAG: 16S rRNA processing protein RimM [Gammaproteobacteria bacterium RIFCSPHIGHO2_02_FULL_42_43]OGT28363.1 MAG: 16S rRNA processing protein RimM [Gammaproteobacteria bacterium RIFCSPHIGHO2_01_FULL_42_8]OGT51198.1 MAG: 16S rRNA processing protein RimM [Gammaproteobacteria bacterium RIFCSPHIGHO2_12_FULL_41_25]OGT62960.1 MAG: 16S rRNA processing protein RimM [Gammaproteobacteria bacterium RIFCSPLOWO2_02_FULL_42_14]OGT86092.1 MAG: 16S rRNA processing protein RimM [Gammaproteobacteria bacterium R
MQNKNSSIVVGRLGDAFGLRGWLHLISFTDPAENIFHYSNWAVIVDQKPQHITVLQHQVHGNHFVVQLKEVADRDHALLLKHHDISVERDVLPTLSHNQYYWADLIGLEVQNTQGKQLGVIDSLFETGANDVMVVQGEQEILIPYLPSVIQKVDLAKKIMIVNWEKPS